MLCSGPSRTRLISNAAAVALSEAAAIVKRQSSPPKALYRWGDAEPKVSAPTRIATSRPRSPLAQPAAIFMPTG